MKCIAVYFILLASVSFADKIDQVSGMADIMLLAPDDRPRATVGLCIYAYP